MRTKDSNLLFDKGHVTIYRAKHYVLLTNRKPEALGLPRDLQENDRFTVNHISSVYGSFVFAAEEPYSKLLSDFASPRTMGFGNDTQKPNETKYVAFRDGTFFIFQAGFVHMDIPDLIGLRKNQCIGAGFIEIYPNLLNLYGRSESLDLPIDFQYRDRAEIIEHLGIDTSERETANPVYHRNPAAYVTLNTNQH